MLHEDLGTFMIIPLSVLLRMRSVSEQPTAEKSKHKFYIQ